MNERESLEEEFETLDKLTDNEKLINCYQMQIDDNNKCVPVYLGKYPDVPLPVNHIVKHKKYNFYIVTYVLTEDEIKNKLYKIVGVNIFRHNRKNSLGSVDFIMNEERGNYQLLFTDHDKKTSNVVENIEKFPGKDKILEYVIQKTFDKNINKFL